MSQQCPAANQRVGGERQTVLMCGASRQPMSCDCPDRCTPTPPRQLRGRRRCTVSTPKIVLLEELMSKGLLCDVLKPFTLCCQPYRPRRALGRGAWGERTGKGAEAKLGNRLHFPQTPPPRLAQFAFGCCGAQYHVYNTVKSSKVPNKIPKHLYRTYPIPFLQ